MKALAKLTATGAARTGPFRCAGFSFSSNADGTLTLHDNASAASGIEITAPVALGAGKDRVDVMFPIPINCNNGVYATIGGTSPALVLYED